MKLFWLLIIPITLASCSGNPTRKISSGEQLENVNCYKDMCVGDKVFYIYGQNKTEALKEIKTLTMIAWDCNGACSKIYIPAANLIENQNGRKYDDLRNYAKPEGIKCADINGTNFCLDQVVGYMPEDRSGVKTASIYKIFQIPEMTNLEKVRTVFVLQSSPDSEELVNRGDFGVIEKGYCAGTQDSFCIGDSYDNGLGSVDKVLAYFPRNNELVIYAGDVKKQFVVPMNTASKRKEGKYEVKYKYDLTIGEKSKKDVPWRIDLVTKERCGYEFFGSGVVDKVRSGEPKISNCVKGVKGPSFNHGINGPTIRTTCDVDYTYYCTHKNLVK